MTMDDFVAAVVGGTTAAVIAFAAVVVAFTVIMAVAQLSGCDHSSPAPAPIIDTTDWGDTPDCHYAPGHKLVWQRPGVVCDTSGYQHPGTPYRDTDQCYDPRTGLPSPCLLVAVPDPGPMIGEWMANDDITTATNLPPSKQDCGPLPEFAPGCTICAHWNDKCELESNPQSCPGCPSASTDKTTANNISAGPLPPRTDATNIYGDGNDTLPPFIIK